MARSVSKKKAKSKAKAGKKPAKKVKAKAAKKKLAKKAKSAPKKAKKKAKPKPKAAKKAKPKAAAKRKAKPAHKDRKPAKAKRKATAKVVEAAPQPKKSTPKPRKLSRAQLDYFREKLLAEKLRVLEEMGEIASTTLKKSISDQSGENSRYSYHLGDVASLSYGREFSMGLAERQQNYLEQVDDALQRIEDGTYGICKVTGELIPKERLKEVPVAKYSVRGKEILAQQRRHGYDERRSQSVAAFEEQRRAFELTTNRRPSNKSG